MISPDLNQEQQKVLISKLVQYEGKLNSVFDKEPLIFSEITKVFNIPETKDTNDSLHKLKERLVNICLQEKEDFLEYLCLPKFRQVSQHALELLKAVLQEISQQIKIEQQNAKFDTLVNGIQRYMPKLNSLAEIQNYHLRIFELYSKSDICPVGAMERQLQMINNQKSQAKELKSHWNFKNSPYSNFVKSVPQDMQQNNHDYWKDQKLNPYECQRFYPTANERGQQKPLSQQLLIQPVLQNASSLAPIQSSTSLKYRGTRPSKPSSSHMIEQYSQAESIKKQKQQENSRLMEEYSQPLSNISELKHKTFNVVDPNFKNCVCKGKIHKVGQEEFVCEFCNGKYHSECLKMENEAETKRKCPICSAEEIQNDCFQLSKPALFSSWAVYNKQNSAPAVIKFTESLLSQMKKIISRPEHKIYLKLITTKKKSILLAEESQNENPKMYELKNKQKQELGAYEMMNEQEQDNNQDLQKEESEMIDQANQLDEKGTKKHTKVQTEPKEATSSTTQTKSSIELTSQYISELVKSSAPILSLNFGYSSQYQDAHLKETVSEEWLIYYGIYEVKRKQLPEILYKVTSESNLPVVQGEIPFDEVQIQSMLENHEAEQEKQIDSEKQQTIEKTLHLQFLISKNQLRQVSQSREESKQIYPVRYTKCANIKHIFELENYLESVYNFNKNIKTKEHYNIKRLSPDIDINHCPICIGVYPNGRQSAFQQNLADVDHNDSSIRNVYLDRKLHSVLNDPEVIEEIIKRYDDSSAGEQFNYVDVSIDMHCQFIPETQTFEYSYSLQSISHLQEGAEKDSQTQLQGKASYEKNQQVDHQESMQVEDYMKDEPEHEPNHQNKQDNQNQDSVIYYGANEDEHQTEKAQYVRNLDSPSEEEPDSNPQLPDPNI